MVLFFPIEFNLSSIKDRLFDYISLKTCENIIINLSQKLADELSCSIDLNNNSLKIKNFT